MSTSSPRCAVLLEQIPSAAGGKYELVEKLGEGGYGEVHKAFIKNNQDAGFFAYKTCHLEDFKGKMTNVDYSEIKALKMLENEENIVRMIEYVKDEDEFAIVFELCKFDLKKVVHQRRLPLLLCDIKNILKQFLTGVAAMHRLKIMHRDLKPSNILVAMDGTIKIADLGNSVEVGSQSTYTVDICTIWYKSPELLFGHNKYNEKTDIWSAGCLIAEFWMRRSALFKGSWDLDQMEKISQLCGFCNELIWPEAKEFPNYRAFYSKLNRYQHNSLQNHLSKITHHVGATAFIMKLLKLIPEQRISADDALNDEFFSFPPQPSTDLMHLLQHL